MPTTPYMSLLLPTVSTTIGPTYATELNAALTTLDSHDHSSGKGVAVPTGGINVNADLGFNSYNATALRSARFTAQGSPIAVAADVGCLFVSGVDLYFNDGNGNHIQLTAGGALNASSIGGIGGDYTTSTATVFYTSASKTYSFWQNTNKVGLMDCGSILLRRVDTTSSAAITIKPDTSLSSGWTLTLPTAAPGATTFVAISSAGALSFTNSLVSLALSAGCTIGTTLEVTGAATFNGDITLGDAAGDTLTINATPTEASANSLRNATTRSTGTSVAAGGIAISSGTGSSQNTSGTYTDVSGTTATITTTGRPIVIQLVPLSSAALAYIFVVHSTGIALLSAAAQITRDGTSISQHFMRRQDTAATALEIAYPPGVISMIDVRPAGTYVYKLQTRVVGATYINVVACKLIAYEL